MILLVKLEQTGNSDLKVKFSTQRRKFEKSIFQKNTLGIKFLAVTGGFSFFATAAAEKLADRSGNHQTSLKMFSHVSLSLIPLQHRYLRHVHLGIG